MRRRALLSGLLVGGLAALSGAFAVGPVLDIPLAPEEPGEEEGEEPPQPPSTEPPPIPAPPGPEDDEEERPPTEPA